jgi:hypothetical protein
MRFPDPDSIQMVHCKFYSMLFEMTALPVLLLALAGFPFGEFLVKVSLYLLPCWQAAAGAMAVVQFLFEGLVHDSAIAALH